MEAGGLTNVVTGALWPHAEHPLHSSRLPCQVVAVGWEEWLDLGAHFSGRASRSSDEGCRSE